MLSNWKWIPGLTLVSLLMLVANAHADKRPYSTEELESTATHIVVGTVQAIYSRAEREGEYEYVRKVAEVKVDKFEKGEGPADLVYVRYFDRNWKGKGIVPPGGGSYDPQPNKGGTFRFYLARNAYDGWSGDGTRDSGYNVVYVNGVQPIEGAGLQGTWQGVEVWDAGEKRTAEPAKFLQITFRGDQFVVRYEGEKMLAGRFSVDDGKTPKLLTLEAVAPDGKTATIPAIYKIEGHKFTLCHPNHEGGDRPSTFSPAKDVVLAVLTKEDEGHFELKKHEANKPNENG